MTKKIDFGDYVILPLLIYLTTRKLLMKNELITSSLCNVMSHNIPLSHMVRQLIIPELPKIHLYSFLSVTIDSEGIYFEDGNYHKLCQIRLKTGITDTIKLFACANELGGYTLMLPEDY